MMNQVLARLGWLMTSTMIYSCGNYENTFQGEFRHRTIDAVPEPELPPLPPDPLDPVIKADEVALHWQWSCSRLPTSSEKTGSDSPSSREIKIEGGGQHSLELGEESHLQVALERQHCQGLQLARDIVFVVDISGSMVNNDPTESGTCSRYDAIKSILDSIQNRDTTRVGLLTFHFGIGESSGELMPIDAFQDSVYATAEVICGENGGTNYQAAFVEALDLLAEARLGSSRELYFLSDGEPNIDINPAFAGTKEATQIKDPIGTNASLATLMLRGDDTVMKSLASLDPQGQPLHRKTNSAEDLPRLLAEIMGTELDKVLLHVRPLGQLTEWKSEDITARVPGTNIKLLENLSTLDYPHGIEVKIESWDTNGELIAQEMAQLAW